MKRVLRTIVKRPYICATCKRKKGELPVHGELAYTPAEMFEMWKQGVPISNDNLGTPTFEPDKTVWQIPIERQRGVDIADVWQAQQTARKRVKQAGKRFVAECRKTT
ncbi:hypothetical protein QUW50_03985 [Barnesiella viscericola]|uniref:hypothetical protein n=1 Tax=Barnesiella viscericola TaxID=397865 RepID=UPI0025A3684B|nr:hypothetical protein [Barnesiella viscericola]MDM8268199.1 hypothetical protein [Barnesiella viscericola]